jgi:hypothetical protein
MPTPSARARQLARQELSYGFRSRAAIAWRASTEPDHRTRLLRDVRSQLDHRGAGEATTPRALLAMPARLQCQAVECPPRRRCGGERTRQASPPSSAGDSASRSTASLADWASDASWVAFWSMLLMERSAARARLSARFLDLRLRGTSAPPSPSPAPVCGSLRCRGPHQARAMVTQSTPDGGPGSFEQPASAPVRSTTGRACAIWTRRRLGGHTLSHNEVGGHGPIGPGTMCGRSRRAPGLAMAAPGTLSGFGWMVSRDGV